MRWLAIVNPGAGRPGQAERCAEALRRDGLVAGIAVSRFPGDAARLAAEAEDEAGGIVAVGGDGTIHEILGGLDRARHALAVMPMGHGNCLARDLDFARPAAAREVLRAPHLRWIDLIDVTLRNSRGVATRRLAACTFAAGYVAVAAATGRGRLKGLGLAAYGVASAITRPRALAGSLALDGVEVRIPAWTGVVVNNTAHLANFRAFPAARLHDARLDVMGLGAGWARQLAHNACILVGSARVSAAFVAQAAGVRVAFDAPQIVMLDGELIADVVEVMLDALPGACRCAGAP